MEELTPKEQEIKDWLAESCKQIESDHATNGYSFKHNPITVKWESSEDRHEIELDSESILRFYNPYPKRGKESRMLSKLWEDLSPQQRAILPMLAGMAQSEIAETMLFEDLNSGGLVFNSYQDYEIALKRKENNILQQVLKIRKKADRIKYSI